MATVVEAVVAPTEELGEVAISAEAGSKKKNKRKKKKAGALAAGEDDDGEEVAEPAVASLQKMEYADQQQFDEWCTSALQKVPSTIPGGTDVLALPKMHWGYKFTGPLRPAFVSPQRHKLPETIVKPDYAFPNDGTPLSERGQSDSRIPVLTTEQIDKMRYTCKLGREVLDIAGRYLRVGVTGDEIDRIVHAACLERNAYPSPLNYSKYPKSVCVSVNEIVCHGIPDCRPLADGDIVNLDVSIYLDGFHADLNETFFIGNVDDDSVRLVEATYEALRAAAHEMRPGTLYRHLGSAIQTEAGRRNCSVVTNYCGHGVGTLFHGPPQIPHYKKNKAVGLMQPGHVFTVEPMLNLGQPANLLWADNWAATTKDGRKSAQFEHTFLVTEKGVEILTARTGTNPSAMPPFERIFFQR